ncbi:hypothetical protein [Amphritea japonica]|uniref:Uncharacterized protein n=1 Tax=Amphritea japonica ATCC BAA-1530 TaxID=1278309 RepID=A0A7R6SU22_9GAMM|nr:hypothetical protein [Amphritea japonica]BBB27856.1 hypothetical protein AMJAP_3271 [Amphritea japonica ATCC BAA-1530]
MINWLTPTSIKKVLAVSLLSLAGLWWAPVLMADQGVGDQLFASDSGIAVAVLDEDQLGAVRGQGIDHAIPSAQMELGIILWDEGGVKKGAQSAQGYSNSVVTVEVYLEGR